MKKLIDALHVIKDECMKHYDCSQCPMYVLHHGHTYECIFDYVNPEQMDIDKVSQ